MVLKVLIFIFIFLSTSTLARRGGNKYFKAAQILFVKKHYKRSLEKLKRGYNFKKSRRVPPTVLFLMALNHHKLKNYTQSTFFFNKLITNFYTKKNITILKALRKDEVEDIKIPKTLNSAYFYMAQNYYSQYTKTQKALYASKSQKFFQICYDSDFNDSCSEFLENISSKLEYEKKKRKNFEFFVYAGRLLFQDRIQLKDNATGNTDPLIVNNSTVCYGAGLRRGNAFKGYSVSGCVLSGTATIENSGGANNYDQSGVPIGGVLVEGGYYIKLDDESVRLGVSLPIIYRSGVYSEPAGFSIPDSKIFNYGIMFSAGLQLPVIELQTKFAHMGESNYLMLNGVYNF